MTNPAVCPSSAVLHGFTGSSMNHDSTLSLAQGVLRRNVSEDFTLGSILKHRMGIRFPILAQPCFATRCLMIVSRVMPCNGSRG